MRWSGVACIFLVLASAAACTRSYTTVMQDKSKGVLGDDFKKFRYCSYPTDSFGLGTAYVAGHENRGDEICVGWRCLGVDGTKLSSFDEWLRVDGFAEVGRNGGAITLTEKENRKLSFEAVLPEVAQVLGLDAKAMNQNAVTATLTIPQAYPRVLDRAKFKEFLKSGEALQDLVDAYTNSTLIMVVGDVVVAAMNVKICKTSSTDASVAAALDSNVGKIVGKDAKLTVGISKTVDGCYQLDVLRPVIVAVYAKRKPQAAPLETATGWDDWERYGYSLEKSPFR